MRFPNARMSVIPQASHLHHVERPEILAVVVKDFLRDIDTEGVQ